MNRAQMMDTGAAYLDVLKRMQALPKLVESLQVDTDYENALKELAPVRAALGHKAPRQSVTTVYHAPGRAGTPTTPTTTSYRTPSGATVTRVSRPFVATLPTKPQITTHYRTPGGATVTQRVLPPTYRQLSTQAEQPWPGAMTGRNYSMPTVAHNRVIG